LATAGYCETCRIGFFGGQLYCSRLSYCLAKGQIKDSAAMPCPTCRNNAGRCGWCDSCHVGTVGNTLLNEMAQYQDAAREFATLLAAVKKTSECEMCAIVMFTGGPCPQCTKNSPSSR
jgi:cytochrome c551/c552